MVRKDNLISAVLAASCYRGMGSAFPQLTDFSDVAWVKRYGVPKTEELNHFRMPVFGEYPYEKKTDMGRKYL